VGEVRTAIRVFNESHRVHREPNVGGVRRDRSSLATAANGGRRERKYSHAYGHCHSYDWGGYFLDSGCSYVHLQARGNLHLFGSATNNVFLGGMLDRHGIRAHVFRHGEYKSEFSLSLSSVVLFFSSSSSSFFFFAGSIVHPIGGRRGSWG
jgi:hypothetical protein